MRPTIYVERSGETTPAQDLTRRDSRPMGTRTMFRCFSLGSGVKAGYNAGNSNTMDNLPTFVGSSPGTSPPTPGSLCDSMPVQQLACYNQGNQGGEFTGTRSRHPGGVNASLATARSAL